jgi:hypothetical protein
VVKSLNDACKSLQYEPWRTRLDKTIFDRSGNMLVCDVTGHRVLCLTPTNNCQPSSLFLR